MDKPLATVIVNSYNRPKLIRDTLSSILMQAWPNIQVLAADDYSNSEVYQIFSERIADFGDRGWSFDVRQPVEMPTLHERQYGQRCSVCINAVMPYANGDFVCYLPDDDFLTPWSIEVRAQYLMDHPDVNAVYGRLEACHSGNKISFGIHRMPDSGDLVGPASTWWCGDCIHDRNGFWSVEPIARAANKVDHSMMMVRRVDSLPEWPEYKEILPSGEVLDCPDAGFFYCCERAGLGPFYSVDEVVTVKRYHAMHHRTDPSRRE